MIVEYFTYNQLPQCQRTKYFNIVIYNKKYLTYFNKYKKLIKNNKINKNKYIKNIRNLGIINDTPYFYIFSNNFHMQILFLYKYMQ